MNSNLKILGTFESGIKTDVAEQFVQKFLEKYENVEGEYSGSVVKTKI